MGVHLTQEVRMRRIEQADVDPDTEVLVPVLHKGSMFFHFIDDEGRTLHDHGYDHPEPGMDTMSAEEAMQRGFPPCRLCERMLER